MAKQYKKQKPIPKPLYLLCTVMILIMFVIGVFLLCRYCIGLIGVRSINTGKNPVAAQEALMKINFPAGYVPYYNMGNIAYEEGYYEDAIEYYYNALHHRIPKKKECPIRINLALSIIGTINFDHFGEEEYNDEIIRKLLAARQILIEKGCAHADDEGGHNKEAQILKDEIDRLLFSLSADPDQNDNDDQSSSGNDEDNQNNDDNNKKSSSYENNVKNRLNKQKEQAQKERSSEQDFYRQYYDVLGDGDEEGGGGDGEGDGDQGPKKSW